MGTEAPVILSSQTDRTSALLDPVVTAIWATVLNALDVHVTSDFFDLGGDSLKMLTMLFQVTEQTGVEVTPAVLFENPTLEAFCRAVRTLRLSD